MTVKELREALATYPDDLEVLYVDFDYDNSFNCVYERDGRVMLKS